MALGISLHFAVPKPTDCCTDDELNGSEGNARAMAKLARSAGFWVREPLVGPAVTKQAVLGSLEGAACELSQGDILLVTFSGHGCQRLDRRSGNPEIDGYDETWCLADGQLVDDELHQALAQFDAGVRILVVSESCHSDVLDKLDQQGFLDPATPEDLAAWASFRSAIISHRLERWNLQAEMREIVMPRRAPRAMITADVILFAACQDREKAEDKSPTSPFTTALVNAFNIVPPIGTHEAFIREVHRRVAGNNPKQHPGIAFIGAIGSPFPMMRPFTI
jgi:hypothetical protein